MMCHPNRNSPAGGNRVEVAVPVVVTDERNRLAVGTELGEQLLTGRADKWAGGASLTRHKPQIVGIAKDDVTLAHVRVPQHPGVRLNVRGNRRRNWYEDGSDGHPGHHSTTIQGDGNDSHLAAPKTLGTP